MTDSTDGSEDDGSRVDYWQVTFGVLAVVGLVLAAFVAPPLADGGGGTDAGDGRQVDGSPGEPGDGGGGGPLIRLLLRILALLLGGGGEPAEPTDPACQILLDRQPTPGAEVTVRVVEDGEPVEDAVVYFNDDRIGRTDRRGAVTGRVPYSRQLRIRVVKEGLTGCAATAGPAPGLSVPDRASPAATDGSLAAAPGGLAPGSTTPDRTSPAATDGSLSAGALGVAGGGMAAQQSGEDDNESVTVEVDGRVRISVEQEPRPGETVTVRAFVDDVPMRRATVSIDGRTVAETDDRGRATVTVPEADTIRLGISRGDFSASRTVDVYLLEVALEPSGLVLVPGGEATVVATAADEPVSGATVTVDGDRAGTTGPDGRQSVALPADPTAPVVVSTDDQTTGHTLLGLYWAPLVGFGGVVAVLAGLAHWARGRRAALGVLGVAAGSVVVLVAGGYWGERGAAAAAGALALASLGAALVVHRRTVADSASSAGGLLAVVVETFVSWALWVVGVLERLVVRVGGLARRLAAWVGTLPRSASGLIVRLVGGIRSLAARIARWIVDGPVTSTQAVGAVLALGALAGAYRLEGFRGAGAVAVVVGVAGVVWWLYARDGDAPAAAATDDGATTGTDAGSDPAGGAADRSPTLRALWREFARRVVPDRWRTSTPGEVARTAVDAGYPEEPVRVLATAFREVEYGDRSPRAVARDRVRAASERLRGEDAAGSEAVEETTPDGDPS